MQTVEQRIYQSIARDINARVEQVKAAVDLLDGGATVPFIARYRKEVTGSLDDTQLRELEERLAYLRVLEDRRATIIQSIVDQGKMTPELESELTEATTKQRLEDLYLPYRPKRRTRAAIAREAGLEPLAHSLRDNPLLDPQEQAQGYVNAQKGVEDVKKALDGARDILAEEMSETGDLLEKLRQGLMRRALVVSKVVDGQETQGVKYKDYFDYSEPVSQVPSHRALALFRGRSEGVLHLCVQMPDEKDYPMSARIAEFFGIQDMGRAADKWLLQCCHWAWRVKISSGLEADVFSALRDSAEAEAINVFGSNLRDLLLAAPAGRKTVIGLDPGLRTGVKVAVISDIGELLDTAVIYPFERNRRADEAAHTVLQLARKYHAELVAIGNGTASRETDEFVASLLKAHPELKLTKVVVSEAGASVYSASETAAKEFPDVDVSYRGAISIARRLQDPLAELVKIDPKAIGVGQYQHDVNQGQLSQRLDAVVEDCVNAVGVDANTASAALLTHVAGLTATRAESIVAYRGENGAFKSRKALLDVPKLGAKTFQQAAGFLRIVKGDNPLDASAVHPESYPVVERIAQKTGLSVQDLIGNSAVLGKLKPSDFTDEKFGIPTVTDILKELEKPGRDPRPEFKRATFVEGVNTLSDVKVGMQLEGVVTNVAAFGAFVDIGVHQDGLVHISCLSDNFVKDPRDVVRVGDVVKVRVTDVDEQRKRIGLTMKSSDDAVSKTDTQRSKKRKTARPEPRATGAMAAAFAKIKR